MTYKIQYANGKPKLLADSSICAENRDLFREFFEFEEYKLKRQNGLSELDESSYNTLYGYIYLLRTVNTCFKNKPWKHLTREDIKRVYDDLEDGRILNRQGQPYMNRRCFYNKVFKSKPFRLAGKAELAREVIEFSTRRHKDVRFITEETFRKLVSVLSKPRHYLLFWLAWDIGENIGALLQLQRKDFIRQISHHNGEAEYLVNLPRSKIKRSRQSRSEPTLYPETVQYADMVLEHLQPADQVFPFGHRQALKLIHSVARKTGTTSMPNADRPTWKDLRSGMACHLLKSGWTREEVDARLGHTPHSSALDAYINYFAIDRTRPKEKHVNASLEHLRQELDTAKHREKLTLERQGRLQDVNQAFRESLATTKSELKELQDTVKVLLEKRN
jgi:integrase